MRALWLIVAVVAVVAVVLLLFVDPPGAGAGAKRKAAEVEAEAQSGAKREPGKATKAKAKPAFVFGQRQARVYAKPIPIDKADDISELSRRGDPIGDAWDTALMASLEENYEETKQCLEGFFVGKDKGDAREWILYLEVVDSEIVEVWSPEWPPDFRAKEGGCFARAIEGTRLTGLRDERRLLKTDFALVL